MISRCGFFFSLTIILIANWQSNLGFAQSRNGAKEDDSTRPTSDVHITKEIHGWTLLVHSELLAEQPKKVGVMLELMDKQLQRIVDVVPKKAVDHLRSVTIWVNPTYEGVRPTAEYHPGAGWLRDNNRNPDMAKCVEITNVDNFSFENKRMPYLMLHELAHAYHDQVLGFRNTRIRAQFEKAEASGFYNEVDRFTGRRIIKDKAYALSNEKEYFAESSEAFFGKNDFFPFNREELKENDLEMHNLLAELWGAELD